MSITGSPKPDRMWNYCALKSWCTKDKKHWDEFCTSCFRCKLGSSKQGAFQLSSRKGGRLVARFFFDSMLDLETTNLPHCASRARACVCVCVFSCARTRRLASTRR